jgi:hypothetical protein
LSEAEICLRDIVPTVRHVVQLIRSKQTDQCKRFCSAAGAAGNVFAHISMNSPIVRSNRVTVVTGSGHHSVGIADAGNVSRLLNRVKQVLSSMSISFGEYKDKNGYAGGVIIEL